MEDDLMLGVEDNVKAFQEKTTGLFIQVLCIVEILNYWEDDPEETLLELGFGKEEADITAKIPSRFLASCSKVKGIDTGVFLQAQKERMDLENPNLLSRFRQLEVFQQITTALSNFLDEMSVAQQNPSNCEDAVEKKSAQEGKVDSQPQVNHRNMKKLVRKASKQIISCKQSTQEFNSFQANEESYSPVGVHRRTAFRRTKQCLPDNGALAPLAEEQLPKVDITTLALPQQQLELNKPLIKDASPSASQSSVSESHHSSTPALPSQNPALRESRLLVAHAVRRKPGSDQQSPESFEMEEVQSFEDDGLPWNAAESALGFYSNSKNGYF
ncbi:protein ITPRID1 [Latimeria chalumnae]|uniref:protein ITPRID1 n=1 Tax=Latimeria chalumnae TaxID=7897 RepID=UPI00313E66EA